MPVTGTEGAPQLPQNLADATSWAVPHSGQKPIVSPLVVREMEGVTVPDLPQFFRRGRGMRDQEYGHALTSRREAKRRKGKMQKRLDVGAGRRPHWSQSPRRGW